MTNKFNNKTYFKLSDEFKDLFTRVPNTILDEKNISARALGVYVKIIRFQNSSEHKIYISGLANELKEGKDAIRSAIKELIELGYIEREVIRNEKGQMAGYVYTVYAQPVENTTFSPSSEIPTSVEPISVDTTLKKKISKKENNKKENKEVVVEDSKEQQLLEMYKSFKLEKRFMPHTKKLLLEYKDSFDLEVFEQVFIYASSEKVTHKYKYLKDTFAVLKNKNIVTIEQYENDIKEFKESKVKSKNKTNTGGSNVPKVKTRFHNINESFRNYAPNELVEVIKESQKDKFKTKKECQIDKKELREKAIDILQERIDSDNTIMFKPNVRLDLNAFEDEINEICNELIQ